MGGGGGGSLAAPPPWVMVVVVSHHHDTRATTTAPAYAFRPPRPCFVLFFGDAFSMRVPRLFWMNGASNGTAVRLAILTYVKGS